MQAHHKCDISTSIISFHINHILNEIFVLFYHMGHGESKNNTGILWHYWNQIKWPYQILTSCMLNPQRTIFSKTLCQLPKGRNLAKCAANWFHRSYKPVEIWHKVSVPDWGWMFIPVCSGWVTRLTFSQHLHLIHHTEHTTRVAAKVLITSAS